jgi:serine/threonine protein kinase
MNIPVKDYDKIYHTIQGLGQGGYGNVLLALNKFDRQYYAVKMINIDKMIKKNFLKNRRTIPLETIRSNTLNSIFEEARILHQLSFAPDNCYPSIVCYYDCFTDSQQIFMYIVMQYVSGVTLNNFMTILQSINDRDLYETNLVYITKSILKTLNYIHGKNIVHGDLKPNNIVIHFLGQESNLSQSEIIQMLKQKPINEQLYIPVIIDFGISCDVEIKNSCHKTAGTGRYIAPEVFKYSQLFNTSDIWSLGVMSLVSQVTHI